LIVLLWFHRLDTGLRRNDGLAKLGLVTCREEGIEFEFS